MPPTYIREADIKITIGTTEYENYLNTNIQITRLENGFDTATVTITDPKSFMYSSVTAGTAIEIEVKPKHRTTYPTNPEFKGIIRFPIIPFDMRGETIILKCDGTGYGFSDTACAQEFGTQSIYPTLDTIKEILTDATYGVVPKWVNKQLASATNSGFSYTTTGCDVIAGTIPYQVYPYKPNNKVVDDLCDIVCALGDGSTAGPHWIVTTDDDLHVKLISANQATWNLYYGGATATDQCNLYQGVDFTDFRFENIGPEANYIVYYGAWRRPSNGDAWTENSSGSWAILGADTTLADDNGAGNYRVNSYSLKLTSDSAVNPYGAKYPAAGGAAWDFTSFREYNVPSFNFWCMHDGVTDAGVYLSDDAGNDFLYDFSADMVNTGQWYHISLPVGEYYKSAGGSIWDDSGGGTWDDIDFIAFAGSHSNTKSLWVDGVHFGDAWVCRGAYNSTNITANKLKIKVVTDDVGKDDSLVAADDSGLIAQMAYNELLRNQTSNTVGYVTTHLIPEVLPGQRFKIYAKPDVGGNYKINGTEMRVTKLVHNFSNSGGTTTLHLTSDVLNSHPRPVYEEWNKIMASTRPEFQDRQSTSMKAGHIDIRVNRLEKDYP